MSELSGGGMRSYVWLLLILFAGWLGPLVITFGNMNSEGTHSKIDRQEEEKPATSQKKLASQHYDLGRHTALQSKASGNETPK